MAILKLEPQVSNSSANFVFGNVFASNFYYANGTVFTSGGGVTVSDTQPSSTTAGGMWFDTSTSMLKIYANSTWTTPSAATVTASAQPNITSVGTLTSANITGNLTAGNIVVTSDLFVGTGSNTTGLSNPTIIAKDSAATYIQIGAVNSSNAGSADFAAYGDNGTDASGWVDLGFTGSNFSDANYTVTGKNDGYVFANAVTGTGLGGNLVFATGSGGTTKDIIFATGGFLTGNIKARLYNANGVLSVTNGFATTGTVNFTGASNVSLGSNANVKITGGTTGQVLSTDGTGNLSWTTSSGGGTPGGSDTYVQFNDGGVFGGDAGLVYNKTTDTLTAGQLQAGSGTGGNISGASIISSNAFLATSQLTLPSATAGQIDYDGAAVYLADNTTSGRGVLQPVQMYRYTTTGAATATAITDYFPASTSLNLEANSIYDIDAHCYFLKNTAGTLTWTWAFSSGVELARSYYVSSIITGFTTTTVTGAPVTGMAVARGGAVTTLAHAVSGSLTTAVYHSFHFKLFLVTVAACNVRLRVTNSAGTITPQTGSFYTVKKLSANAGVFAA